MPLQNFWGENDKRQSASHRRSPKQEQELALRTKGRVTPGSGNGAMKGDVRVKGVARIEAKTTMKKSFSVTREMVRKIEEAGVGHDEMPVIVVEFLDNDGKRESELVIMPSYALDTFLGE